MTEEAPNIETKLSGTGRLVYDKERRTIARENLPCPICGGVEGCDHSVKERAEAAGRDVLETVDLFLNGDGGGIGGRRLIMRLAEEIRRLRGPTPNPLCGYSIDGFHVQGDKVSIDAVAAAFHSHSQIDEFRRNLRHWIEECGKLHARVEKLNAALAPFAALADRTEYTLDDIPHVLCMTAKSAMPDGPTFKAGSSELIGER